MTIKTQMLGGVPRYNIFASAIGPQINLEQEGTGGGGNPPNPNPPNPNPPNPGPSDADAKLLKENMAQKGQLKELTEKLKAFEGINLDEVKTLLADKQTAAQAAAAAETAALEAKGEWDRLKERMAKSHKDELDAERARTAEANQKATTGQSVLDAALATIADLTVGSAFGNSKFVADELVLTPSKARQIYAPHFETEEGKVVAYDKPRGAAERTPMVDGQGKPLPFDLALKALVEADPDHEALRKSKLAPGSGSKTTGEKASASSSGELRGVARIQAQLEAQKSKAA